MSVKKVDDKVSPDNEVEIPIVRERDGTGVLAGSGVSRIPLVTIVVPARREESIDRAAVTLQAYLERIFGACIRIEVDTATTEGTGFYIGSCRQSRESDLPPEHLGLEAFAIRVRDGNVFFCGRKPYAVEFAVYSFLEDCLGVRWFVPGPLGDYIPSYDDKNFSVHVKEVVQAPDYSPRVFAGKGFDFFDEWAGWKRRNKISLTDNLPFGVTERLPEMITFNGIYKVFPPGKYAKTHPEYYPMIDGKRWIPPVNDDPWIIYCWFPCGSNPEVIRLTVEFIQKWFDENPEAGGFPLGIDDVSRECSCDNCRALDPAPKALGYDNLDYDEIWDSIYHVKYKPDDYDVKYYNWQKHAEKHFWFVNKVAKEIAKTHPDRYICCLIAYYWEPLKTIDHIEPNVYCYMPREEGGWFNSRRKKWEKDLAKKWSESRKCKHLCRYSYWANDSMMLSYFPHYMAEALESDHKLGFKGFYTAMYGGCIWSHTAPMFWAGTKLLWDSSLDIDKLLAEYFEKMYEGASSEMAECYALLEKCWMKGHVNIKEPRGDSYGDFLTQGLSMTLEEIQQCEDLLEKAKQSAKSEIVRQRIDFVAAGLEFGKYIVKEATAVNVLEPLEVIPHWTDYVLAYKYGENAVDRSVIEKFSKHLEVKDEASARKIVEHVIEFDHLVIERRKVCKKIAQRADLIGQSFQALSRRSERFDEVWLEKRWERVESKARDALLRALKWYKSQEPEALNKLNDLIETAPENGIVRSCYAEICRVKQE